MVPLPLYDMSTRTRKLNYLKEVKIPETIKEKKKILSKGTLSEFKGEGMDKFLQMTVKGMTMYYYDFGIAYPEQGTNYPIFMYQIISAPKRILVVVQYITDDKSITAELDDLLSLDKEYSDMLIKEFRPQDFMAEDILPNTFNGLVRTTEIDKAYDSVIGLFEKWYEGLVLNKDSEHENILQQKEWISAFKKKFYTNDYGFTAAKKFVGKKWAAEVFDNYLFS